MHNELHDSDDDYSDISDEWDADGDDSDAWHSDHPHTWDADDEVACPHCGALVYEDSIRCPVCGEYITFSTSPWQGKPLWWILLGALGVGATIMMLTRL